MKNLLLLFVFVLTSNGTLCSQDIYVVKSDSRIYKLSPNNILLHVVTIKGLGNIQVVDIAISPANKLYGMTTYLGIIEIDWETGEFEMISTHNSFNASSLVCANENELYYLNGNTLCKYNIALDSIIVIRDLGFKTPGDICILHQNIIFPTYYEIKAYNVQTDVLSTVYCFPERQIHFGISSFYSACDSSSILLANLSTMTNPDFIKIDLNSGITTPIEGHLWATTQLWGMASNAEYAGFECDPIDFPDVDCEKIVSTFAGPHDQEEITVYPNPVKEGFHIKGCTGAFTMDIYNTQGLLVKKNPDTGGDEINISDLSAGVYFLSISCEGVRSMRKIIKQ